MALARDPLPVEGRFPGNSLEKARPRYPTILPDLDPAKKNAISVAAFSALSEPCTELASMLSAKSLRMVPAAALAGSVAPMTSRFLATAFSPSSTCTTTGSGGHEPDQRAVERALLVDGVEGLGLLLREVEPLLRDDAQARLLEAVVDGPGEVAAGGIGLDDREGALGGHEGSLRVMGLGWRGL